MAIKEGKTVSPKYERRVLQASHFVGTTLLLTMALLDTCIRRGHEIVEMPNKAF